jgi:NAD+ diphosphatase
MSAPPNTFAGAALDRAGARRRDGAWLAAVREDPASRAVVAGRAGVAVAGDPPRAARVPLARLPPLTLPVLLGVDAEGALFAADEDAVAGAPPAGLRLVGLREAGATLPAADAGLLAYAAAMVAWHAATGFCARCGAPTRSEEAGHLRVCTRCAAHHHPRTDPVVITLVEDPERDLVLLGRQPSWPPGRYSCLAGFVEPGESLEEAVARELEEEAGVAVEDVTYASSQPWPFPAQLMFGFTARYAGGEPHPQDEELEDVRWFARDELAHAAGRDDAWEARVDGAPLLLPPPLAIARRLIDGWLAGRPPAARR